MPVIVWLAAAAVAAAIPVAWWALSAERGMSQQVTDNLAEYQPTMRQAVLARSATDRFVLPLMRSIGTRLIRFTPIGWVESRANLLARAGWTGRVTPEQVLGAKLILPLVIGGLLTLRLMSNPSFSSLILTVALVAAASYAPDLLVRARADRRADDMTLLLPDVLDQLTISVEAGLGFEASLERILADETHALAEEFGRMLQDVRLGTSRRDALDAMAERSQVDDLRTVVLTLRQAEILGAPLAETLRGIAADMREKRRFRAEEQANQLPVRLIFPLGLCILPALFIVILGPAVIRFTQLL